MKLIKLTIIIIFLIFQGNMLLGQNLVDSVYGFTFIDGEYSKDFTRVKFDRRNDSIFTFSEKYNSNDKVFSEIGKSIELQLGCGSASKTIYYYNTNLGVYELSQLFLNEYDKDCNLKMEIYLQGEVLDTITKTIYHKYDKKGNVLLETEYNYDKNISYKNRDASYTYVYDANDTILSKKRIQFNYEPEIQSIAKDSFIYEDNKLMKYMRYNFELNHFILRFQNTYHYTDSTQIILRESHLGGKIVNTEEDTLIFNKFKNTTVRLYARYNTSMEKYLISKVKTIFFYHQDTIPNESSDSISFSIKEVKTSNYSLEFMIENPFHENLNIQIYNYLGQLIFSDNVISSSWQSPIIRLIPGIYFINAMSKKRAQTRKIFVP